MFLLTDIVISADIFSLLVQNIPVWSYEPGLKPCHVSWHGYCNLC